MHHEIARFHCFAGLNQSQLDLLAKHAGRVCVPAGRWLLRPGRTLRGHFFLLHGVVKTLQPDRVVDAGQSIARHPIYPGVAGLRTLTDCELLQVSDALLDVLNPPAAAGLILVAEPEDCWQARFLGSELMAQLPPAVWQSVLSRLNSRSFSPGDRIIEEGDPESDRCFILTRGRARVLRQGVQVAVVEPGGLFGEDALISREPRNASVEMLNEGVVAGLGAGDFRQFLVDVLLQGAYQAPALHSARDRGRRVLLRLASSRDLRERIERMRKDVDYLVSSSRPEVEALAIFLLRKYGLRAWAAPAD